MNDDEQDELESDDETADAETTSIETKAVAGEKLRHNNSHLTVEERTRFIDRMAVLAEHVRRLADQLKANGIEPCVEPPAREVTVQAKPLDFGELEQLRTELKVAQSAAEEHLRQKAALRVQLNTLSTQLSAARAELERAKAATVQAKPAAPASAPANPTLPETPAALVLAFLRGRDSSAHPKFIAERIGFGLTMSEVEAAIERLRKAGSITFHDLAGTPTWRAAKPRT